MRKIQETKRRVGRPRIYTDRAEQMRVFRANKTQAGYKFINAALPSEYKELMDKFCRDTQLSIAELICYLLGCAQEQDLPDVTRPIDFHK